MRKTIGRKTKLNRETQETICQAIRDGNYLADAAIYGGIDDSTFYRWMEKGAVQTRGKYREFRRAVKKAEVDAKVRLVAKVQKAVDDGSWQAAMTLLERRWPAQFARRDGLAIDAKVEHSGEVKHEIDVAIKADPAIARALAEASNRYFYALRGSATEPGGAGDTGRPAMDPGSAPESAERLPPEGNTGRYPVLVDIDRPASREIDPDVQVPSGVGAGEES